MPLSSHIELRTSLMRLLNSNDSGIKDKMHLQNITKQDVLKFFDEKSHYFFYYDGSRPVPVSLIDFLSMESTIEMIKSFKEREMRARAKADNKPLVRRLLNSLLDGSVTSIQEKMDEHNITKQDVLIFFEKLPHFFLFNDRDSLIYLLTEASPEKLVQQANKNLEGVALKTEDMAESMMKLIERAKDKEQERAGTQAVNVKCSVGMEGCYPSMNPYLKRGGDKKKSKKSKSKKYRKKSKKSRKGRFPQKKSRKKRR
jgi:hypothetical protein